MNKICHVHIPKTGGRYIQSTVFKPLVSQFSDNNIQYRHGHFGLLGVDQDTYTVTSFRDPVKRTISHFCFNVNFKITDYTRLDLNKNNLFKWVENNLDYISNFQSKNFLYLQQDITQDFFFIQDPVFLKIQNFSKEDVLAKINNINIFLKDTDLNIKMMDRVRKRICKDFNLNFNIINQEIEYNRYDISSQIYNQLTGKEKRYLYSINKIDSDIYFDELLFWNRR